MSELINNRVQRRERLKEIILELHAGKSPDELKDRFRDLLSSAGATEIAELESELISAGLAESEVKRLCDVHVAVFEDALKAQDQPETTPGHPIHTFGKENEAAAQVVEQVRGAAARARAAGTLQDAARPVADLRRALERLRELEKHYLRKENLLFPYLERHGIAGPPKVMWALHDDIRDGWKALSITLSDTQGYAYADLVKALDETLDPLLEQITGLFDKEVNILFPMALETLTDEEWRAIKDESDEIGYTLIEPGDEWPVDVERLGVEERRPATAPSAPGAEGPLPLHVGALTPKEVNLLLNKLPIDITYVDQDDTVRYFSKGEDRIFVRTEAVIGRKVQDCHPPASVHIVNRILDEFRAGRRDVAEFWIQMGGRFVHIRYYPLRDEDGAYLGTIEVTQDITEIRELSGERRLLSEE